MPFRSRRWPSTFIVAAALQVHFARLAARLDPATLVPVGDGVCPACGGAPVASAIVGWPGAHGTRFCACSLCATQWHVVRIKCVLCGSTKGIAYQELDGGPDTVKAETCENCHGYVKILQQQKDPALDPVADDVATLGLDCCCARTATGAAPSIRSCSAIEGAQWQKPNPPRCAGCPRSTRCCARPMAADAAARFGRSAVVAAVRETLAAARANGALPGGVGPCCGGGADAARNRAAAEAAAGVQPHRHRAAHQSRPRAAGGSRDRGGVRRRCATRSRSNSISATGQRGERDDHVRDLLCELTGAEDATVVNNNAAAVLLVLNTLAKGREAIVSRGELIEIGGAFRMPEIMSRAGAKLVEVGTTNRTHKKDYVGALGPKTGLILKVHTSNYRIEGFTKEVSARDSRRWRASARCRWSTISAPARWSISPATGWRTSRRSRKRSPQGADLVTFSGDKLLGGPQAGFIVGRKDLIARINSNPMKRALRIDKIRLAALEATLRLYRDPDRLAERLPTLRLLARPKKEIEAAARRLLPVIAAKIGDGFDVGSCRPAPARSAPARCRWKRCRAPASRSGRAPPSAAAARSTALSMALRRLPIPVVGRIEDGALILDLRCLDDEEAFIANLATLDVVEDADALA